MQLCHTHRQLLSRFTLRWYSVGATSDTIAASDVQVPSRLKRPVASTFGGLNIQNVVVPAHKFGNRIKRPSRSNGSNDQSPDLRRRIRTEPKEGLSRNGASSRSSWGDGVISLSFGSRLQLRQDESTTARGTDTEPYPQGAQLRQRKHYKAQQPQMQEHDGASQRHSRDKTRTWESATRAAAQQGNKTSAPSTDAKSNKLKESSMTRPSSSPTLANAKVTKTDTTSRPSSSNTSVTQQPTTTSSDRKALLATLSTTNLNALFRTTTNTPTAGMSIPSLPSSATTTTSNSARARVRSVLEHSAGDYSRFLPRSGGARKDASCLPALRAARYALAIQRDVSLKQRRVALHIIAGLVQPRREVRA